MTKTKEALDQFFEDIAHMNDKSCVCCQRAKIAVKHLSKKLEQIEFILHHQV